MGTLIEQSSNLWQHSDYYILVGFTRASFKTLVYAHYNQFFLKKTQEPAVNLFLLNKKYVSPFPFQHHQLQNNNS